MECILIFIVKYLLAATTENKLHQLVNSIFLKEQSSESLYRKIMAEYSKIVHGEHTLEQLTIKGIQQISLFKLNFH